jgi:tetratricopeptide (TPR) repeat protein
MKKVGSSNSLGKKSLLKKSSNANVDSNVRIESKMSSALSQAMGHVKEFMTDSQKALILLREGKNFMDANDFKGAIECFNEGISLNPSVSLFNMKAVCHKSMDLYTEAYFDYSYTIRLEPDVGSHYCSRGLCLAKLKKASMAIEDLDIAVELDPSSTHLYSRAVTFADFGKYESAIDGEK